MKFICTHTHTHTHTHTAVNPYAKQYATGVNFWVTRACVYGLEEIQTRLDLQIQKKLMKDLFFLAHTLLNIIGGIALMHPNWNTLLTQSFKGLARVWLLAQSPWTYIAHNDLIPSELLRHICQTHTFCSLSLKACRICLGFIP